MPQHGDARFTLVDEYIATDLLRLNWVVRRRSLSITKRAMTIFCLCKAWFCTSKGGSR